MGFCESPINAQRLRPIVSEFAIQPIERYSSALVGDGVTDDSTAIMSAHDAAYAAGVREVYCSKQYYAPTAYNIGNVLFRGPGALLSTYRKKIIPLGARAMAALAPKIIPAIHLRRFATAVAPVVVILGDSTGTWSANHISVAQLLWPMLQQAIRRDNPGKTITFTNRAIGATTIQNYFNTGDTLVSAGITLPSWFTPTGANWGAFISNQTPDLVIIDLGTNGADNTNIANIDLVVQNIIAFAKRPDILFVTNLPRSTQADAGSAENTQLEYRDYAAGALRSYAEFNGYGLIDMHRLGCMLRDGFDPCAQLITQDSTTGALSLPALLPFTEQDFDLTFTIDNAAGAAFGAAQQIGVTLSPSSANYVRFDSSGGNFRIIGTAGSVAFMNPLPTGLALPTSTVTIQVAVRNNLLSVWLQGAAQPTMEIECMRQGGRFQPSVSYISGSGATQINVTNYAKSSPALVQPAMTDAEMFGVSPFATGGNAINHPASATYEAVHSLSLDNLNFCALDAGRPTQSITAAAAINAEAAVVKITGPSSSTYAITLAAPLGSDAGRSLSIEMISTTSTNTVTLALTNVTGGTASTTCTWNAAAQKLLLVAGASKWEVIKQDGVTLT